jgi:hypothetical protein
MKFLINEGQYWFLYENQLDFGFDEKPDFLHMLCKSSGNPYGPFCKLKDLRTNLNDELINKLNYSVQVLYDFFGLKNYRLLPKIVELSLESPERTVNTLNTIAVFINDDDFDKDATKKQLRKLRRMSSIPDNLDDIIRDARTKEYTKYENYFINTPQFEKKRTGLSLSYKCGDKVDLNFLQIAYKFKDLEGDEFEKLLKEIKVCIKNSLKQKNPIKADVVTQTPLYVEENGEKVEVFPSGSNFEVKKMDSNIDSYLSEFFSVFKQSENKQYKETHMDVYNKVVQSIYEWITVTGKSYLDSIKRNTSGMIYDNETIIPMEYIELYWSNSGQRNCNTEKRLSIRFRIKPEYRGKTITGYKYVQNSDILKKIDVLVSPKEVEYQIC